MGLTSSMAAFLIASKKKGVSFDRSLTIGRQSIHFGVESLRRSLQRAGLCVPDSVVNEVFVGDGYIEPFLSLLGASSVESIDNSSYEHATHVADLNHPVDSGLKCRFSVVIDSGSTEHIFNYPQAIKTCMECIEIGGYYLGIVPATNLAGHGFYQFSVELMYRVFSKENGFETECIYIADQEAGARWLKAADPAVVLDRVEYQSSRPAYMYVRARKVAQVQIFDNYPQQSDYVDHWKSGAGDHVRRRAQSPKLTGGVAGGLPDSIKRAASRILALRGERNRRFSPVDIFED